MGYIGNQTSNSYTSLDKQVITGDGGASYTLDHAVANENELEVFVNNVRQEPSVAYTVSGTALTMTGNVAASDDFYVVFQGKAIQTTSHPEGQDLQARDGTFSGDLTVDTDTLHVDATNNRVGIGTTSPSSDATLHLASGSSNKPHMLLENTVSSGGDPGITFADSVENYGYRIGADDTGNAFVITYKSGGINPIHGTDSERLRILSSGGITFNGDTASANALDDYEEGTWTPDLTINNSSTGIGYISRTGAYIKVGRMVYVEADVSLNNKGSTTGTIRIAGLPFTIYNRTGNTTLDGGGNCAPFHIGTTNVYGPIGIIGEGNTTLIRMYIATSSNGHRSTNFTNDRMTSSFGIRLSLVYQATA